MGVKLQLLLGFLLFDSICTSEDNSTSFQNVSSEKIDSTKNFLEKLPKTDSQINLVNKDTQDDSDSSFKYSKYPIQNDTHKNQTRSEESVSKNDRSNSNEKDGRGRQDNSRSIDVDKFAPSDFHNNDYSSSDNQKFLDNTIRKSSTKDYVDFLNFQLTTPKNEYFDSKFEEARQKLEQEYEENIPEPYNDRHMHETEEVVDDNDDDEHDHLHHDLHIDRLFGSSKHNPNSSLDYKEKTKISRNNTFDKNSEHNELRVEKVQKLNFASEYNFTMSDEDDATKTETIPPSEKVETISPRGFVQTTSTPTVATKPHTGHINHILNDKIKSEIIKAINLLTTEYSTTQRLKEENDIIPKEQNVEENKIIPIEGKHPKIITTEHYLSSENIPKVTKIATTTEQINTTGVNDEHIEKTTNNESYTTTEQYDQTAIDNEVTFISDKIKTRDQTTQQMKVETITETMDEEVTATHINEETTTEKTHESTPTATTTANEETTLQVNGLSTTTDYYQDATDKSTIIMNKIETTTIEFSTDQMLDTTSTTLPLYETTTHTPDLSTIDPTTIITTSDTKDETITTEREETTEAATTESDSRISKAFTFEETTTTEHTITTTNVMKVKLFSTTSNDADNTTQQETTITIGTEVDKTPTTDTKTTTQSSHITPENEFTLSSAVTENETTIDYVHVKENLNTTTDVSQISSLPFTPTPFDGQKVRNGSGVSDETTTPFTTLSTEEYTAETSSEPDTKDNKGKIAAIVISTVGALSLILLAGLLYIMRKRQKRFNYKQRCRPVSLDHYSVDNVSGFNSTRRKADRQSKRSYGNPAFDDPVAVTHPLNFPALANFTTNADDIKAEFEEIPQITAKISELPEGCETKNRYANVIPLPETRVCLRPIDGYPNSDYINANYVVGPKNTKGYYIACQGPTQNTVDDFWRMVWEQQSKVILMITHLFENGNEKCVDYLPPSEVLDCNRLFGDFQITLKKRDVKDKYIISNLQLKNMVSNSWREVTHFWYLGWPEKGVPTEENSLIAFLIEARSFMKSSTLDKTAAANGNTNGPPKNEINPVVVHCSPGTGRTGVVIACDIAIREFEQTRLVDIPKIVYRIRRDRASAVQTKEQYIFIYKVVSLYATKLTGGALDSF